MNARSIYDRLIALTLSNVDEIMPGIKAYVASLSKPSCLKGDEDENDNRQVITVELTVIV
jgi:hypothetical protein